MGARWAALLVLAVVLVTACAADAPGATSGDAPEPTGREADPVEGEAEPTEVEGILVAAASDLRPAFEALAEVFAAETGTAVAFDFGSSGQLAQRIIEGAPFDLFASANVSFVEQVLAAEVGDPTTQRTYAFGRIVLWAPEERWGDWEDLEDLGADDTIVNLAIANPEHAPYGLAAEQALEATGTLDGLRDRLVFGENISDTQRLVESGNADVGILALSLALAADEREVGRWVLLDDGLHEPLQQDLVVTAREPAQARAATAFADLVDGADGREVMRRYGFLLPGEEGPT